MQNINHYYRVALNNRSIALYILIGIACLSFPIEYYHHYCDRVSEIEHNLNIGPPLHCTVGTRSVEDIGWSEWITHKLYRDERDVECLKYMEKILQPRYPNPIDAILSVSARIMGLPILAIFTALSTAIHTANRLFAQTIFNTILILVVIAYVFNKFTLDIVRLIHNNYNTTTTTNNNNKQETTTTTTKAAVPSVRQLIQEEFKWIYGETMHFVKLPYFHPEEQIIQQEKLEQIKNNEIELKIMNLNQEQIMNKFEVMSQEEINEICTQQAINAAD